MEKKKIWKVRYETEVVSSNKVIKPKGFSSIVFRNIGDTDATILNDIPIKGHVSGDTYYDEFFFINRPEEIIDVDIPVRFSTTVTTTQLLMIKTYYEESAIVEQQKQQKQDSKSSDNTLRTDFIDYSDKSYPIK